MAMIKRYISKYGGLIPAITRLSADIVRGLIEQSGACLLPIKDWDKINRIITHKNPHLDEYMAVLLFRALLPDGKRLIPLEECILSSADNDNVARAAWPDAAVIGLGGVHNGGAFPRILLDEHIKQGEKQKEMSATMLVWNKYLGAAPAPPALSSILREVDCIDANGGAHNKNLANYIKKLHETELILQSQGGKPKIQHQMDSAWKEACVNACIAAALLGIKEGRPIFSPEYWKTAACESLDFYKAHSALKGYILFNNAFSRLKGLVASIDREATQHKTDLRIMRHDGTYQAVRAKNGDSVRQYLLIPYITALCKEFWGAELGGIIMMPFWEVRIMEQMAFIQATKILKDEIFDIRKDYPDVNTAIGRLSVQHISKMRDQQGSFIEKAPMIVDLESKYNARSALTSFINTQNDGLGYVIFRNAVKGNVVLSKGNKIPDSEWRKLTDALIQIEGNSDSRKPGCWHVTPSDSGIAPFLVNGNAAHQYIPKSSITANGLAGLLNRIHRK